MDALRDFLIEYNTIVREFNRDSNTCTYIPVFTDESYVNRSHAGKYSWLKEDSTVNRSSSRGEWLIILHAISPFGPFCEKDDNNYPISDLVWKRDTPHSTTRADGLLTCETLWKSQSSTGDYHDNMNSKMFMKWVEEKLCPTWGKLFPTRRTVLVCDNEAYYHKREIGSLGAMNKSDLIKLCLTIWIYQSILIG
jgi:hypothetical protein